jgi:hypothetical protein
LRDEPFRVGVIASIRASWRYKKSH